MKYVYLFEEGNKDMRKELGGKGANLAEMTNIGLPVPSGFTITTNACNNYYENDENISKEIKQQIEEYIEKLENKTGKKLGDLYNPLLLSVRSGSPISMPGMMDTILNLGMNDQICKSLRHKNARFIYDSYRRFIQMFSDVVKGLPKQDFENVIQQIKNKHNLVSDLELSEEDLKNIVLEFKQIYFQYEHEEFPQDSKTQLILAIEAVFKSWNNERAKIYRKMNKIDDTLGTAVNVQEMVYGNLGDKSLTGVAFSRNPATGENKLYGEYLMKAQGEDIVAGIRTPKDVNILKSELPHIYSELLNTAKLLEHHYKDMQDMEFTVENNKLFMLQTRNGKRTAKAAIEIAVSLVENKMITKEEAISRINPEDIEQLLHPTFDDNALKNAKKIAQGLSASPGAATGQIFFNADDVIEAKKNNKKSILVRLETSPEDIAGMKDAEGVLTVRGGMTSHAAVVARGMGRCCVSGCENVYIDAQHKTMTINSIVYQEGDYISLDGSTGTVYEGTIQMIDSTISGSFEKFMKYVDEIKTLGVRANADTKKDAEVAKKFGAEGIGLCRTEHMFFEKDKIFSMRKMIVSKTTKEREDALAEIIPMQTKDFEQLFKEMNNLVVTIRYLDPPLHEFLPKTEEEIIALASSLNIAKEELIERIDELKEFNPMLGHRGCRLAVTFPEIAIMQTKAVIGAALNVQKEGYVVKPEIMIPLVGDLEELKYVKSIVQTTANELMAKNNIAIDYKIGTMIEVPRAAILSDEIATEAEFFSYGTNDLTQMTYGFSRDDASKFINDYIEKGILKTNPFKQLDNNGITKLMKASIVLAKKVRKNIDLGICGEHGGNPESIKICQDLGLSYVSCSPYRVPIAKIAAAQAKIGEIK